VLVSALCSLCVCARARVRELSHKLHPHLHIAAHADWSAFPPPNCVPGAHSTSTISPHQQVTLVEGYTVPRGVTRRADNVLVRDAMLDHILN